MDWVGKMIPSHPDLHTDSIATLVGSTHVTTTFPVEPSLGSGWLTSLAAWPSLSSGATLVFQFTGFVCGRSSGSPCSDKVSLSYYRTWFHHKVYRRQDYHLGAGTDVCVLSYILAWTRTPSCPKSHLPQLGPFMPKYTSIS